MYIKNTLYNFSNEIIQFYFRNYIVINNIIFDELCQNIITKQSQEILLNIIQALHMRGADSVILGCTELCLSVDDNNCNLSVFDTTDIHCRAAIKMMLSTD